MHERQDIFPGKDPDSGSGIALAVARSSRGVILFDAAGFVKLNDDGVVKSPISALARKSPWNYMINPLFSFSDPFVGTVFRFYICFF